MATVTEQTSGGPDLGLKKGQPIVEEPSSDTEQEGAPWATGDFGNNLKTPEKMENESRGQHLETAHKEGAPSVSVASDDEGAAPVAKPQIRGLKTFGDKYMPFAAGEEAQGCPDSGTGESAMGRVDGQGGSQYGERRGAPACMVGRLTSCAPRYPDAGFENMIHTAPVYRSARLHAINPTAAVSDDVSYLYTLVSSAVRGCLKNGLSDEEL